MSHRSLESWLDVAISRRSFVLGGMAICGLPIRSLASPRISSSEWRPQSSPFTLGVASGDPTDDGVVLWTRLATDPLNGGGMPPAAVDVQWEVSHDERFGRIAKRGRATATPEWGHSVHVEVDGLDPERWYFYRFRVGDVLSATGRTRTMPRESASPDHLRFGFVSCQNYEAGLFTAYDHLAKETLDVVFHLGDYIYESPGAENRVRKHVGPELMTLTDYRNRLAQYKTDAHLQAAHAAFPWVVTWDDHEVDNNYADTFQEQGMAREAFLLRRAAAYQAYYEHMPLRRRQIPKGPSLELYRDFTYGQLASFFVLDTRQYRTDQPCADGNKAPCGGELDANATLLGARQERWLLQEMARSRGRWNVLPQQVMMARVDQFNGPEVRVSMDQWPGYERQRQRLLEFFGTRSSLNPIVLTGDIHSSWVNDLQIDATNPRSPVVGTEFVGTSITSGGDGSPVLTPRMQTVLSENPCVKFFNGQRGYVTCDLTPARLQADYRGVDFVTKAGSPVVTRASFIVENGRPGAGKIG